MAWILRYRDRLRIAVTKRKKEDLLQSYHDQKIDPLKVHELEQAEREIIKVVQRHCFRNKLLSLQGSAAETINPLRHYHSGLEHMLSMIRERYCIVQARVSLRRILNGCFHCKRTQASMGQQKMANLPKDRVCPSEPPFSHVRVDCFGPLLVPRGRSTVKRYDVLFTCMAVRAIHIEVAHNLDTDSFIHALRHFIVRRGQPQRIRSDIGSNFVRGKRELREAIQDWNQEKIL